MAILKRNRKIALPEAQKIVNRAFITSTLRQAVIHYYAHKRFSCYAELGVLPWGKRRLDVFAMNMKGRFVGVEIKSCLADYRTDLKWREYLEHVNKFYFCIPATLYDKIGDELRATCRAVGAGIMILNALTGHIEIKLNARDRDMDRKNKIRLLLKVAWRGGESKRTIKRRKRLYLTDT